MDTWLLRMWAAAVLALGAVACGDDDSNGSVSDDAGGVTGAEDAGSVTGGDNTPCISTFEGLTLGELKESAETAGACISETDVTDVCVEGPADTAAAAGTDCFIGSGGDADLTAACILEEIAKATPDLSVACQECFSAVVVCTAQNCAAPCGLNPTSDECTNCRIDMGCRPNFFTCAGLPDVDQASDT